MNSKPVPAGCGQNHWPERRSSIEACAEEGGTHANPKPAGAVRKQRPLLGLLLVAAPWVLGITGWALYVRWN